MPSKREFRKLILGFEPIPSFSDDQFTNASKKVNVPVLSHRSKL